ncbi:TPA: ACT domain-containing protein [Candidatus Micrarchaeota archaeon]|nr:ACT domain-containing protein [Candidatus Micrarchaeota archaeon]
MPGISDLPTLLKSMRPKLVKGELVFCSVPQKQFAIISKIHTELNPLLVFREDEGITLIIEKKIADKNNLKYSGTWAFITLTVNSDLSAVGFLATITTRLAKSGIPVNAVSAYHHDHIFVPHDRADNALRILRV